MSEVSVLNGRGVDAGGAGDGVDVGSLSDAALEQWLVGLASEIFAAQPRRRHHEIVHEFNLGITLVDGGRDVRFTLPDGTRIHPAPTLPAATGLTGPDGPLAGTDLHPDQLGGWDGGPCDYSLAVAALQHRARAGRHTTDAA